MNLGLAEWLFDTLTKALKAATASKTQALADYGLPIVGVGLSIYIMMMGLQYARGKVQGALSDFATKIVRAAFIISLVASASTFDTYVVSFLEGLQTGITTALSGQSSVYKAVDNVGVIFDEEMKKASKKSGLSGPVGYVVDGLFIVIFMACRVIILGVTLVPLLLSFSFFHLAMALGPIFILCLLFPPTSKYFDAWLSTAITAMTTHIVVTLIVIVLTNVIGGFGAQLAKNTGNPLSGAVDALILVTALCFIAWKAGDLAAQLTGGTSSTNPLESAAASGVGSSLRLAGKGISAGYNKMTGKKKGDVDKA